MTKDKNLKPRTLTHTEVMERIHLDAVRRLVRRVGPGNGISQPPRREGEQ